MTKTAHTIQASIRFPKSLLLEVDKLAQEKDLSRAWVIKDALKEYFEKRKDISNA